MCLLDAVPAALHPLLPKLVATATTLLDEVETAHAQGEHESARRSAHSLKGVGMSFGIAKLTHLADKLQTAAANGEAATKGLLQEARLLVTSISKEIAAP